MEIVEVSINKITPYDNNPRNNDKAVNSVANSIKEFGWQQPIVVDEKGVIIAGHTRFLAAKQLGMDKVPVKYAKGLSDEQAKAFRLADNKTSELSEWDFKKLEQELGKVSDIDMSDFGFEDFEFPEEDGDLDDYEEPDDDQEQILICPDCGAEYPASKFKKK